MKLKHHLHNIYSNYYVQKIREVNDNTRIKIDPNYNISRNDWLKQSFYKYLRFKTGLELEYIDVHIATRVKIFVDFGYYDYTNWSTCKELKLKCRFEVQHPKFKEYLWGNERVYIDIDREDNEYSITEKVKARIKEMFYPYFSLMGQLQQCRGDITAKVLIPTCYRLYREGLKKISKYDYEEVRKCLERRYNINLYDVYDLRKVAKIFEGRERSEETLTVKMYCNKWIYDYDGDIDEVENEFYNTLEDNVIYI